MQCGVDVTTVPCISETPRARVRCIEVAQHVLKDLSSYSRIDAEASHWIQRTAGRNYITKPAPAFEPNVTEKLEGV